MIRSHAFYPAELRALCERPVLELKIQGRAPNNRKSTIKSAYGGFILKIQEDPFYWIPPPFVNQS